MSGATLDPAGPFEDSRTRLSRSPDGLSRAIPLPLVVPYAVRTPSYIYGGLGSSAFARRYLRNHCYFLFLRLLRCFSSPGSPRTAMNSPCAGGGLLRRVSPFRDPRIRAHLQLPAAFRSLSRLSSAPSARASTLRPTMLNLLHPVPLFTGALRAFCPSGVSPAQSRPAVQWFSVHHAGESARCPFVL